MNFDHEMPLAEAVRVCRAEAAKHAGEVRIALNALADFTAHETAKRERGNAAAMREALEKIRVFAKTFMDETRMRHVTDSARIDVGDIEYLANTALSTPPRNCDRFATREEARSYFDNFVCLRSNGSGAIDCKGCSLDSIDNPHRADCREAWLFAPVERKGEGDGR